MSFLDTLLGRKHAPMIGLDISSSSVKLVELGQTSTGEYVLERFASEPFEKGWITDGQVEKFDEWPQPSSAWWPRAAHAPSWW